MLVWLQPRKYSLSTYQNGDKKSLKNHISFPQWLCSLSLSLPVFFAVASDVIQVEIW